MRFFDYLKDKAPDIAVSVFTYAVIVFFMLSFGNSRDMIILLSIVAVSGLTVRVLWDYFRKRKFYHSLLENTEQLDKKHFAVEITETPDFLEGKIISDILFDCGRAMNESIDSYRRSSEDFREFIELWVHEIKLPVAGLLLMAHNDREDGRKYTEQLQRVDSFIENVLYYSRSESMESDYVIRPVKLSAVFRSNAIKHRSEIMSRNVSIHNEGLDTEVSSDEKCLEFIVGQFLGNSMKYFAEDREPEIRVYAEEKNDCTVFHFRDNGVGIPASDLPYIFRKSYTGENGRTHSRSTGMGLYIVKTLCERLGHRIEAESVQGEYTDIVITFGKNDLVKPE